MHKIIIIGGGISAHTAAIYTARAALNPIIISAPEPDQLSLTTDVENFPGFPNGVQGPELVKQAKQQAEKFGAIYQAGTATTIQKNDKNTFTVTTDAKTYEAKAIIICTGASAKLLDIPGEKEYFGKGVSTCAVCDAAFYKNLDVVVIGGGDSAMEESLALTKFAKKVTILHRRDTFRASKIMQDRVLNHKKIEVMWNTTAVEVVGDGKFVKAIKTENLHTKEQGNIPADGMFLAIGHIPNTHFCKHLIKLDDHGYIITNKYAETNVPGIFAGGDCQDPVFKQAITSAGDSCKAALAAEKYVENLQQRVNDIHP